MTAQPAPAAPPDPTDFLASVRPHDWRNPTPAGRYDFLVIGGGPAGLGAAERAAAIGARVALIESDRLGGASLSNGCVPTKALIRPSRLYGEMRDAVNYGAAETDVARHDSAIALDRVRRAMVRVGRRRSARRLVDAGIDVHFGHARFVAADAVEVDGERLRFKKALIATGSHSVLPEIPGLAEAGVLSREFFNQRELPRSVVFIGGGPLVCEMAQALARLGSRVVIVHKEPLFLPKEERDAAQMVSDALAREGIEVHLNSTVVAVRVEGEKKLVDCMSEGVASTCWAEAIVAGIGRAPNLQGLDLERAGVEYDERCGVHVDDFLRTSNRRIHAAGDVCLELKFTDTADASARIAVANALLGRRLRMSAVIVPWCTYTDPEIAHVGLYVQEARRRKIPVKTFTVPMHDVDRAIADGEEEGFVKLHVRDGTDTILGATIVARHAGEMINVISLAMVAGIGLKKLSQVVYAYPTQALAIKQAADAYTRTRLTPWVVRILRWWVRL